MTQTTINEVLSTVTKSGRVLSRRSFYRFAKELGIEPLGTRQRPQRFPGDTANRILAHLGMNGTKDKDELLSLAEIKRRARKGGKR